MIRPEFRFVTFATVVFQVLVSYVQVCSGCCLFGTSEYRQPISSLCVSGEVIWFAYDDTLYATDGPGGRLLMPLVADVQLRLETASPTFTAYTRIGKEGLFEFEPLTGRGMSILTGNEGLTRSVKPDKLTLAVNELEDNPYIRTTQLATVAVAQPTSFGEVLAWSSPGTVDANGTPEDRYEGITVDVHAGEPVTAEVRLVLRMTDSAASYLAHCLVRPRVSSTLNAACILATAGDYAGARDSLATAATWHRHYLKLVRDSARDPGLEESLNLAKTMVQGTRRRDRTRTTKELLEAAQSLLAANATYKAREYDLKHNTLSADIERKTQELLNFVETTQWPARKRFSTAANSFLESASAEELYDLAILYGFSSLLRE